MPLSCSIFHANRSGAYLENLATCPAHECLIEHYLSQQLWGMLADPNIDICVKVQQLTNLFSALDIRTTTEPSAARGAIILATVGLQNISPTANTLHNLHVDLKKAIKTTGALTPRKFPPLHVDPITVNELGEERLTHAFGDTRPATCLMDVRNHLIRLSRVAFQRETGAGVTSQSARRGSSAHSSIGETESPRVAQMMDTMNSTLQALVSCMQQRGGVAIGDAHPPPSPGEYSGAASRGLSGFVRRASMPELPWNSPSSAASHNAGGAALEQTMPGVHRPNSEAGAGAGTGVGAEAHNGAADSQIERMREEMHAAAITASKGGSKPRGRGGRGRGRGKANAVLAAALSGRGSAVDDEGEDEEVDDDEPPQSKRPAGHKKRPAASVKPHALAGIPHPPMMNGTVANPPDTVYYNGGKITMSFSKKSYRCFANLTVKNPSDRSFYWADGGKEAAWERALAHIDLARREE